MHNLTSFNMYAPHENVTTDNKHIYHSKSFLYPVVNPFPTFRPIIISYHPQANTGSFCYYRLVGIF